MKLKWWGHACFLVTANDGTTIITDPYTPETAGYKAVTDSPDVVIMSSANDLYHCRADLIPGQPLVINALEVAQQGGQRAAKGVTFTAIKAMEALDHHEHDPDQNGMYRFSVDGISIGHLGDVGNALTNEQITFFKGIDVLLALVGGHPTIALDDLKTVIDEVKPRFVVPMHFRTLRYKPRNTFWIDSFLSYFKTEEVDFVCDSEATITQESLPKQTRALVLTYV